MRKIVIPSFFERFERRFVFLTNVAVRSKCFAAIDRTTDPALRIIKEPAIRGRQS